MNKQGVSVLSSIFKGIAIGIKYTFKGIGWYVKSVEDLFRILLRKESKHPQNKGEVL